MKNMFKKHGMLKSIGTLMILVTIILLFVANFVDGNADMILKVIGLCFFTIGGLFNTINSDEHRFVKSLFVFIFAAVIASWLFPYGYFQGANFVEYEYRRIGIVDLGYAIYYSIQFTMDKIVLLLVAGGFYGVLAKVTGYQKLIEGIAKKLSKNLILTSVCTSILLFVLTSLFNQTFVVLLFIPFFISVLTKMNMDKISVFAITFGSVLVGILGATYGTDSLITYNYYTNQNLTFGLNYRFIIAAIALVVYNFLLVVHIKNTNKKKNQEELVADPFLVENTKKKVGTLPAIIVLAIVAIVAIIGYISWQNNWNIEVFAKFHDWLIKLDPFDNSFNIFSYILGVNAEALGSIKYVFGISSLLLVSSALIAFLYKMKLNEYIESFYEGIKVISKPIVYIILVYVLFGMCYLTPFIPTLTNWILNLVKGFNPFLTSLVAFIVSAFHSDLGYSAYTVGGMLSQAYADNAEIANTLFTAIYGLVQLFMPSSVILAIGLSLMKVDYKEWLKYIWMFVVGMLVILLVFFAVLTYI